MKRFGFIVSFFFFIMGTVSAQLPSVKTLTKTDFKPYTVKKHPVALRAIKKGEKPASFKNVKMALKPNVVILKKNEVQVLRKQIKKGILPVKHLKTLPLQENKIYIDPESRAVFKPLKISDDTLLIQRPPLQKVIKEFRIPEQKVRINLANTTYAVKGAKISDEQKPTGDYLLKMEFNDTLYKFNKEIKTEHGNTKISIGINLNGHLYIKNPVVSARYTGYDGYSFTVFMEEDAQIEAKLDAKITSELAFPIWAFDIPAGEYGSCNVGIYGFIDTNGELHLKYTINQNASVTAGLKGKTFSYYPRSYTPVIEVKNNIKTDYTIEGELKVFGGVKVEAKIKVLKYNLATVTSKSGPEVTVKLTDKGRNFSIDAGARFRVKAKLIKIDKTFTLLDKYYSLWSYQKKNYGGYIMEIKSADAYNDRVWGQIYSELDSTAYQGKLTLRVVHMNGSHTDYPNIKTDEQGIFAIANVPLVKGDRVKIKVQASPNWSPEVATSIPFKEIKLHYADYYTNQVSGSIASKIDLFPKQKTQQPVSQAQGHIPKGINPNMMGKNLIKIKPNIKITNDLFKNAITYKGDVSVIVTPGIHKAELNLPAVNLKRKRYKRKSKNNIKLISPVTGIKKQVINLPFGAFVVKNVDIKPYDLVKVRINIDGFVLESNTVRADGLVFSPSEDINLQGGIYDPFIKADDSYTVINPLRSNKTPTGKVHMIKGIDMKHTSPTKTFPGQKVNIPKVKEFKNAIHPLVFYDKTVNLQASSKPGFSEAHTGPWQVNNIYYDRSNMIKLQKFDGHRFEYIGYFYDNIWITGYKYYQKTCRMDKDFLNKISKPKKKININPGKLFH